MTIQSLVGLKNLIEKKDKGTFQLEDYAEICLGFLNFVEIARPMRIPCPSPRNSHYIFYEIEGSSLPTRPLNTQLFIESSMEFKQAFRAFRVFLSNLRKYREEAIKREECKIWIESKVINKVVYTMQQSIGCIGDSFANANQARKKVGQLFEVLIQLIIQEIGLFCQPRTVRIPIPGYPGYEMSYEFDLVFARNQAIITSEYIHSSEIVGSVKTTSKDRIDKIFLDKFLLKKLLNREIPVVAFFLHDVQRATAGRDIARSGDRKYNINSTFKTNHFLGYTVALNKLDGVYFVDPRPEMAVNERLREQIRDFQEFIVKDVWLFSKVNGNELL